MLDASSPTSNHEFNRQILGIIDNNPSSMHREYNEFYAVRVYLRSIRISLVPMASIEEQPGDGSDRIGVHALLE